MRDVLALGEVELTVSPDTLIGADFTLHESLTLSVDYTAASLTICVAVPGDTNGDGCIDLLDLTRLANNWEQSPRAWPEGDFNDDGNVDLLDLTLLANNWQHGCDGQAVPEPAGLLLAAIAGLAVIRRRH